MPVKQLKTTTATTEKKNNTRLFTFLHHGQPDRLPYSAVTHISKYANDVIINTVMGNYKTSQGLKEIEAALPPGKLCRIHRSHIISLAHIKDIGKDKVFIGESYFPISPYDKEVLYHGLPVSLKEKL